MSLQLNDLVGLSARDCCRRIFDDGDRLIRSGQMQVVLDLMLAAQPTIGTGLLPNSAYVAMTCVCQPERSDPAVQTVRAPFCSALRASFGAEAERIYFDDPDISAGLDLIAVRTLENWRATARRVDAVVTGMAAGVLPR